MRAAGPTSAANVRLDGTRAAVTKLTSSHWHV